MPAKPHQAHAAHGRQPRAAVPAIPFTAAAHEHAEQITLQSVTPGAAAVQQGPFDVNAYGYARHIYLEVTATGGVLGAGVLSADYPFNLFQNISLLDVNGAPIVNLDGYSLLQMNVYGGFGFRSDPRLDPSHNGTINAQFFLRIPIEVSRHNGLGSLANQNAAAAYKLQWTINASTVLYSTAPTTVPTFTIRPQLEAWSLPNATDLAGRPQAQIPPAHGTTAYLSFFSRATPVGALTYLLPRVGNLLRVLLFIGRDGTGARNDGVVPNPLTLTWDARILTTETQRYRITRMSEALMQGATRDTGVFAFLFNNLNNGQVGDEDANLWLPTVQSTRLELNGNTAVAGSLMTITNDIAPVEVQPSERFVETSASGFHPRLGEPNAAAQ